MLAGWREHGLEPSIAIDPTPSPLVMPGADLRIVPVAAAIPAGFAPSAIVLAVKPQFADDALPPVAAFARDAVVLSIMAGRTVANVRAALGDPAVVRAMPNTPATIRQGVTVAFAGQGVSAPQHQLCDTLLQAVGAVAWVDDESLIDPVTAVSGGGPAYVFLLTELLERAAIEQGIPADLARLLARRTVSGSGALLAASEDDAAELRRAVTSPKGTTERALAVLMADAAWPALVSRAIAAATARSRELAG